MYVNHISGNEVFDQNSLYMSITSMKLSYSISCVYANHMSGSSTR